MHYLEEKALVNLIKGINKITESLAHLEELEEEKIRALETLQETLAYKR